MNCPRCSSLLFQEALHERDTSDLQRTIYLLRCPMCGFYTDRLMETNRENPKPEPPRDLRPGGLYYLNDLKRYKDPKLMRREYRRKGLARKNGTARYGIDGLAGFD